MKGRAAGREAGFLTLLGPGLRVVSGGEGRRTGSAKLREPPFLGERALLWASSPPPFHTPFFSVPPKLSQSRAEVGRVFWWESFCQLLQLWESSTGWVGFELHQGGSRLDWRKNHAGLLEGASVAKATCWLFPWRNFKIGHTFLLKGDWESCQERWWDPVKDSAWEVKFCQITDFICRNLYKRMTLSYRQGCSHGGPVYTVWEWEVVVPRTCVVMVFWHAPSRGLSTWVSPGSVHPSFIADTGASSCLSFQHWSGVPLNIPPHCFLRTLDPDWTLWFASY